MFAVIVLIFAILFCVTLSKPMEYTSKLVILSFQIIWCIVLLASTFQPYGLFLPTEYTYMLLLINVFSFSLGFLALRKYNKSNINLSSADKAANNLLKNSTFRFLLLIACLITLYYFSIVRIAILAAGNLADIRNEYYSGELLGSFYAIINGIFLQPMLIICYPLLGYALYRRNWMAIPLIIFMVTINSLAGGRFGYVKIFYALIFFFGCIKRLKKKSFIGLTVGAIFLIFALSYVTASRYDSSGNMSDRIEKGFDKTLEHISTYACGATVAFDYSIKNNYTKQIGGNTYGAITGSSVVQTLYIVLNKIGLPFDQPMERLAKIKQNDYIWVGSSIRFNALYTAVLFFYTDFGVVGVIFIPFLLGLLSRFFIKSFLRFQTLPLLMLITYCYILILFSITDFNFTTYTSLFMVIILYWLGTKKSRNRKVSLTSLR